MTGHDLQGVEVVGAKRRRRWTPAEKLAMVRETRSAWHERLALSA